MKYALVLQFTDDSEALFEAIEELEDSLAEELDEVGEVDGHDIGSDQLNVFIFTDDPAKAFQSCKKVLTKRKLLQTAVAAFREADGEDYTVIWPEGHSGDFQIL